MHGVGRRPSAHLQKDRCPDTARKVDSVLVRVEAAGVNYADVVRRRGDFYRCRTSAAPRSSAASTTGKLVVLP
jgi:NADPH:quinone reductase-like Zn-dependent oxidoreductase